MTMEKSKEIFILFLLLACYCSLATQLTLIRNSFFLKIQSVSVLTILHISDLDHHKPPVYSVSEAVSSPALITKEKKEKAEFSVNNTV